MTSGKLPALFPPPSEAVKAAAVAMSEWAGDGVNHPWYADLFRVGLAAYDRLSEHPGADATSARPASCKPKKPSRVQG